ncbi:MULTISPECIES: hypothetical protein [unclassified Streptomyces]|uniref:hypothetical protein n=1 Tax=unclassified Streptomyces TaxID=2593676 RepID=UPI000823906F|nr:MULTISPECIES: hypothetical protein [unclassified Streptomyces]MYU02099.1 hypothetical protein [Streptomyces sp. SID8350]SCK61541.1 hypothetical protein YUWDRAFT_06161 [Streptomyces sp. AmelKG-D3]
MARIRTIKPEAFESEDLASVSLTAERTFFGLLTQADDSGRHRDHPAIIAGRLWALRPEHTATHVARDLDELASAGLVCRYTGCDGRTWLHIVTWDQHQKINKATVSRLPRCPVHQPKQHCGKCQDAACPSTRAEASAPVGLTPPGELPEDSRSPQGGLPRPVIPTADIPERPLEPETAAVGAPTDTDSTPAGKTAGQRALPEDSRRTTGGLREESRPGSRILDPGSFLTGREAPATDSSAKVSAKQLVGEYVRGCARRPPEDFLGHLGRKINALLDERFEADDIRAALDKLRAKGLNPSVLPSLVNEVVNATPQSAAALSSASGAGPWASTGSSYTPYLNPTAEPTTFGGRL